MEVVQPYTSMDEAKVRAGAEDGFEREISRRQKKYMHVPELFARARAIAIAIAIATLRLGEVGRTCYHSTIILPRRHGGG